MKSHLLMINHKAMNLYKKAIILVLTIFSVSCKKHFLDNVNSGATIFRQDYVVDLNTLGDFMRGVYPQISSKFYTGYQIIYPELIADNIKPVLASSGTTPFLAHYSWAQQASEKSSAVITFADVNCNGTSQAGYGIIRSCNFVLEKSKEYEKQDQLKADLLKGEAYGIRAWVFFELANIFAQSYSYTADGAHPGVVIVTTSDWTEPVTHRNSVTEVYAQIISDLNNAIQLLPPGKSTTLLMNREAARALLARVYLFKGDYLLAKNAAVTVNKNIPIMTAHYPAKLFTPEETEALLQMQPGVSAAGYATDFANYYFRKVIQFKATSDIAVLLAQDANDLRKNWVTVATDGSWNITKYPVGGSNDATFDKESAYYQTILRSSETYLIAAECYAKLNNRDSSLYYLQAIQRRANVAITQSSVSDAALLDAIYTEKRKELAFEGSRMFELLRLKKGVIRTDETNPAIKNLPYPSNKAIAPLSALDVKLTGMPQNIDY
jgi:hypothetical protein